MTPRKSKAPAFQFYANDFLTGTQTMTLAARGAYITLLCQQWDKGGLAFDVVTLARLLSCARGEVRAILGQVSGKFRAGADGLFRNARIEQERRKQRTYSRKMAQNGKKGGRPGRKPRLSFGFPSAKAESKPTESSSSSSSVCHLSPLGSHGNPAHGESGSLAAAGEDGGDEPPDGRRALAPRGGTKAFN